MEKLLEICCGSFDDACAASAGGASRIELNSALFLGGLTPSLGTLAAVKAHLSLKVVAMVRPRGAGFCYTPGEMEVMEADGRLLMQNGADGLVFGFLDEGFEVDAEKTRRFAELAHAFGGEAVFHRAFDCVKDPDKAVETLISLGVDRVLTSGLADTAPEGAELLAALQRRYGGQIELLAGSGVTPENAPALMEKTGIMQLHSSCKDWRRDPTTAGEQVSYSYAPPPHGLDYEAVSAEKVRALRAAMGL
ncbi:MAG: copper homeostasis protein CutC [Oscillospiraceae bacterium]|nr:copper homeostasis protein CutC [Oscillospiraceae bacterium]